MSHQHSSKDERRPSPPTTFSSSSSSNSRATKSISPPSWRTKKYENFRQNLHGLGERGRISLEGEDDDKGIFFTCTFAIVHQSTILLIFLLVSRMWEMHVRAWSAQFSWAGCHRQTLWQSIPIPLGILIICGRRGSLSNIKCASRVCTFLAKLLTF